jgi:hypothetical protein
LRIGRMGRIFASGAIPEKIKTMSGYGSAYGIGGLDVKVMVHGDKDILDLSAGSADKMIMGGGIGIETVEGAAGLKNLDQTLGMENIKVSIYCSEA